MYVPAYSFIKHRHEYEMSNANKIPFRHKIYIHTYTLTNSDKWKTYILHIENKNLRLNTRFKKILPHLTLFKLDLSICMSVHTCVSLSSSSISSSSFRFLFSRI